MLEIFTHPALNTVYKHFRVFKAFLEADFKLVFEQKIWKSEFVLILLEANYSLEK